MNLAKPFFLSFFLFLNHQNNQLSFLSSSLVTSNQAGLQGAGGSVSQAGAAGCQRGQAWQWAGPGSLGGEKHQAPLARCHLRTWKSASTSVRRDYPLLSHCVVGCGCAAPTQKSRAWGCAEVSSHFVVTSARLWWRNGRAQCRLHPDAPVHAPTMNSLFHLSHLFGYTRVASTLSCFFFFLCILIGS